MEGGAAQFQESYVYVHFKKSRYIQMKVWRDKVQYNLDSSIDSVKLEVGRCSGCVRVELTRGGQHLGRLGDTLINPICNTSSI